MATKRTSRRRSAAKTATRLDVNSGPAGEVEFGAETTGRKIITFVDASAQSVQSALSAMKSRAGISTRISILTLVRRQYTPTLPEYHVFPR